MSHIQFHLRLLALISGLVSPILVQTIPALAKTPNHEIKILNESDASLYSKIFKIQEKGQWTSAKVLINQLSDELLLGHIIAQRLLHPTKYRSRYKELKKWLKS